MDTLFGEADMFANYQEAPVAAKPNQKDAV